MWKKIFFKREESCEGKKLNNKKGRESMRTE